ncbi:MAG: DUF507 family protein [Nitrospirota bacterium]
MRLTGQQIQSVSEEVVREAVRRRALKLLVPEEEAFSLVEKAIADDLMVEDRLNEEVKDILKQYEKEIEQGRADYKTIFDLVKKKLVRERGLVL